MAGPTWQHKSVGRRAAVADSNAVVSGGHHKYQWPTPEQRGAPRERWQLDRPAPVGGVTQAQLSQLSIPEGVDSARPAERQGMPGPCACLQAQLSLRLLCQRCEAWPCRADFNVFLLLPLILSQSCDMLPTMLPSNGYCTISLHDKELL